MVPVMSEYDQTGILHGRIPTLASSWTLSEYRLGHLFDRQPNRVSWPHWNIVWTAIMAVFGTTPFPSSIQWTHCRVQLEWRMIISVLLPNPPMQNRDLALPEYQVTDAAVYVKQRSSRWASWHPNKCQCGGLLQFSGILTLWASLRACWTMPLLPAAEPPCWIGETIRHLWNSMNLIQDNVFSIAGLKYRRRKWMSRFPETSVKHERVGLIIYYRSLCCRKLSSPRIPPLVLWWTAYHVVKSMKLGSDRSYSDINT